jgi:hypothetical protein
VLPYELVHSELLKPSLEGMATAASGLCTCAHAGDCSVVLVRWVEVLARLLDEQPVVKSAERRAPGGNHGARGSGPGTLQQTQRPHFLLLIAR